MTTATGIQMLSSPPSVQLPRWKGLAVLLVGVAGLVVGIGVGVRWLAVGAFTWESIGSIAILSGAFFLTGWGVIRATNRMRPVWRAVAGLLLTMTVALVVWTFTPAIIATRVPPLAHPAGELDPGGHGVSFTTADGVRLWGWYLPPTDGKVVVLRHGAGSTAFDVRKQASVLFSNGYGVLMTDARGHGRSEGTAMDFGWYGDEDIAAAIDFLTHQPEVDTGRIAIVGMSMGGEEAIGAMAADDRIAAVVAEGATARTDADKVWLVDAYGWRGWIQTRLEWMQYTLADLLTGADKPGSLAEAVRSASPRPILMITAGKAPDEEHAAGFIAAGTDNVTIWTVPDAGHIQGVTASPEGWEVRVIGFLDVALG